MEFDNESRIPGTAGQWLLGFAVIVIFVIAVIGLTFGAIAFSRGSGGIGATGATGATGPMGPAGPLGPPGPGAQAIFSAANSGTTNTVKLALGSTYTVPGLLVGQNVCYASGGTLLPSTNCFTVAPNQELGVKQIQGQNGYGFFNMTTADLTFDLDLKMNLAYTYPSSNSPTGGELNLTVQPFYVTWNAITSAYYPSTALPSVQFTFAPQAPCGQVGGIVNVAYSNRFTLPANVTTPPPGFPSGCGYGEHPPLLVLVLTTGGAATGSDANNWLASVGPGSIQITASA